MTIFRELFEGARPQSRLDEETLFASVPAEERVTQLRGALLDAETADARAVCLMQLGRLLESLDNREEAVSAYEQARKALPGFVPALRRIRELKAEDEDWPAVAALLEEETGLLEDEQAKIARMWERADLLEYRLKDEDGAREVYRAILERDPAHEGARDTLERLVYAAGDWRGYHALLEERLEREEEPVYRLFWLDGLIRLNLDQLHRNAEAGRYIEQAREEDPEGLLWVRYGLELAETTDDRDAQEECLKRLLALPAEAPQRSYAHDGLARLLAAREEWDEAASHWLKALHDTPGSPLILEDLAQAYRKGQQWEPLHLILERALEGTEGPWRSVLLHRNALVLADHIRSVKNPLEKAVECLMAMEVLPGERMLVDRQLKHLAGRLKDPERLIELLEDEAERIPFPPFVRSTRLWIARILEEERNQPEAVIQALLPLLEEEPHDGWLAARLAQLYQRLGEFGQVRPLLEGLLEQRDEAATKYRLSMELGDLLRGRLNDYREARHHYAAALAAERNTWFIESTLEFMARAMGDENAVLEHLNGQQRILAQSDDPALDPLRLDLALQIAEVLAEECRQPEQAVGLLEPIRERESQNLFLYQRLRGIYGDLGRWEEACALSEELLGQSEDPRLQLMLRADLARLHETRTGRMAESINHLRYALILRAEEGWLREWQRRLAVRTGDRARLADLYGEMAERSEDETLMQTLLYRQGTLYEQPLDEHTTALNSFEELMERNHSYLPAIRMAVLCARERESPERQARVMEQELPLTKSQTRKTFILFRIGLLHWHDNNHVQQALRSLQRAFEMQHECTLILETYAESLGHADRWREWVTIADQLIEQAGHPWLKWEQAQKTAQVLSERLERPESALEYYQRALQTEPRDLVLLERVKRLQRQSQQWEGLRETLARERDAVSDPKIQTQLLLQSAWLEEMHFGDLARAAGFYLEILNNLDPRHETALVERARLLMETEDWAGLMGHFEVLLKIGEPLIRPDDVYRLMARTADEKQKNLDAAIEYNRKALEVNPKMLEALHHLQDLHERCGHWRRWIEVCDEEREITDDPARRVYLLFLTAKLWVDQFERHEEAIRDLRQVLEIESENARALGLLANSYEKLERWEEAEQAMLAELKCEPTPARQFALYMRLGELRVRQLGDRERGLEYYRAAGHIDPANRDALECEQQLLEDLDRPKEMIEVLRRRLELAQTPEERVALHRDRARLMDERLDDPAAAREDIEQALRLAPADESTLSYAADLAYRAEEWGEAQHLYLRLAKSLGEEAFNEDPERLYRMGVILAALERPEEALRPLDTLLAREGEPSMYHADALRLAGTIARQRQDDARALEYYTQLKDYQRARGIPSTDWWEDLSILGDLQYEAGEPEAALESYMDVLNVEPEQVTLLRKVAAIHETADRLTDAIVFLERAESASEDDEEKADLLIACGRLSLAKELAEEARDFFRNALICRYDDLDAWTGLKDVYQRLDDDAALEEACGKLLELEHDKEALAAHATTMGAIRERSEEEIYEPLRYYKRALDFVPAYGPALDGIERLYESSARWAELIEEYEELLKHIPQEEAERTAAIHRKIGEIYANRLDDLDKAISSWTWALRIAPDALEVHQALADCYAKHGGRPGEEIREHSEILRLDPLALDSYKRLSELYDARNQVDRVFCCRMVQQWLGSLGEHLEQFQNEAAKRRPAFARRGLESEDLFRHVQHPAAVADVINKLALVDGVYSETFGRPADAFPLRPSEQVTGPDGHALHPLVERISTAIGLAPVTSWYATDRHGAGFIPLAQPVLCLPPALLDTARPERMKALIARLLAQRLPGYWPVLCANDRKELERNLLILRKAGVSDIEIPGLSEVEAKDWVRAAKKNINRKNKAQLKEALVDFRRFAPSMDFDTVREGVQASCDRVALLISGDVEATVWARATTTGEDPLPPAAEARRQAVKQRPWIGEIFRFAVGEPYFNLRQKMGLTLTGGGGE